VCQSYARAVDEFAPHTTLVAPAVASPVSHLNWISTLLAGPHHGLGVVSAHEYRYSACAVRRSPEYPTITRLLGEAATAGMADSLRPAIRLAHRAGFPFRLTELNSVTRGLDKGSQLVQVRLRAPRSLHLKV
jgi:hypothetical protein